MAEIIALKLQAKKIDINAFELHDMVSDYSHQMSNSDGVKLTSV